MRILILGGTRFVGRHLTDSAISAGHEVTLFNRGQSQTESRLDVETIIGDRDGGLAPLRGRRWDAVIDTCGYVPRLVSASAELLADAVEHYTFISTISVYAEPLPPGADENGALGTLVDKTVEEITRETYGPLKVLCEQAAEKAMLGRVLNIRPGLIVGPFDPTDRFTYWPVRISRGGEVLLPSPSELPVQFIDARDLAEWVIRMAEQRITGVFNAAGPAEPLVFGQMIDIMDAVLPNSASYTWVSEDFLRAHGVIHWMELPVVTTQEDSGILQVSIEKAVSAGLAFRPLSDTVRETYAWHLSRPTDYELGAGLAAERETELLALWKQQNQ